MKKFLTANIPIAGIPVPTKSSRPLEVLAAIITFFSVSGDVEEIADDISHLTGRKPKVSAFASFMIEEMVVARNAVTPFPLGAIEAADIYFNIYPNKKIQLKIKRFNRSFLNPSRHEKSLGVARLSRVRRRASKNR